jgi:hypothetical protein
MKFLLSISLSMLCISVVNTTFFTLHDLEGYLKKFLKWGLLPTPNSFQEGIRVVRRKRSDAFCRPLTSSQKVGLLSSLRMAVIARSAVTKQSRNTGEIASLRSQ